MYTSTLICVFSIFKRIFDGIRCEILENMVILYFILTESDISLIICILQIIIYVLLRIRYSYTE